MDVAVFRWFSSSFMRPSTVWVSCADLPADVSCVRIAGYNTDQSVTRSNNY